MSVNGFNPNDKANFAELFGRICEIKNFVLKLNNEELRNYKTVFYNQKFAVWRLDLMWEFIWGDIDYETMYYIFKNNKLI